jgi:hypothetical protein
MRTGRPIPPLAMTDDERETLERWARRPTTAQALASARGDRPRLSRDPATRMLASYEALSSSRVHARSRILSAPTCRRRDRAIPELAPALRSSLR